MDEYWYPSLLFLALFLLVLLTTGIILSCTLDSFLGAGYIIFYPYFGICTRRWFQDSRCRATIVGLSMGIEISLTSASMFLLRDSNEAIVQYSLRIRVISFIVLFVAGIMTSITYYFFPRHTDVQPKIATVIIDARVAHSDIVTVIPSDACPYLPIQRRN